MTTHFDPLHHLRPIRKEEFDELTGDPTVVDGSFLVYDVYRLGNQLVIEFDVPGIKPSEIEVNVEDRWLDVTVHRSLERTGTLDVIETGRQHGRFTQRLLLSDGWDISALTATVHDGVLDIRTPMADIPLRRHIDIEIDAISEEERAVRIDEVSSPDPDSIVTGQESVETAA